MSRSSWGFYSNLTHEVAEKSLLEKGIHGNYLCRRSQTTPGSYTLCVRRRNEIHQYKIINDGDTFELYESDGFASVPDLIDYYRKNPDKFVDKDLRVVELTEPLVLDDEIGPSLDAESWYFGTISHDEAQKFLCEKGGVGSYLVRESRSQPGCYVLSVRNPGPSSIIEFLISYTERLFHITTADQLKFQTIKSLLEHYQKHPIIDKATDREVKLSEPLCETAERVRNDIRIAQEFENDKKCRKQWLQIDDKSNTNPKSAGLQPYNRGKNRYKNILPYDLSRVVLHNVDPEVPGSDYINASYIFDDESSGLFIASQGCVKATVDDFWHMLYQENTRIIIMVTNEVEKGKIKCVRYWPDPGIPIFVNGREVSNVGETCTGDYIIRQFEIDEDALPGRQTKRVRKIYHYQFVGWPDHGVPKDPGSLLEMMSLIEATQKTFQYPGPPIIHCSAGIGRTGTVIVINMLMNLYQLKGTIDEKDVPHTVQKVRCQRGGMVQTEAQYRFIYRALVFYMKTQDQKKKEAQREAKFKSEYSNLEAMNSMLKDLEVEDPNRPPLPPRE